MSNPSDQGEAVRPVSRAHPRRGPSLPSPGRTTAGRLPGTAARRRA
ncbi:hypothetical protein B7760_04744 [Burkholderia glumae]|nr:hypothetical protein KS03_4069 [Burkholderia glumae LMG 2196 = ATCC 33617]QKM50679.1 hypothetical protein B7760_04744 [Burkholderia glumae]QKM55890.1 hypothetical protein CG017_03951 [Burkholderia glumae]QTP36954.1 hypothetical protein B7759_05595 [Burkholderia glumae]